MDVWVEVEECACNLFDDGQVVVSCQVGFVVSVFGELAEERGQWVVVEAFAGFDHHALKHGVVECVWVNGVTVPP